MHSGITAHDKRFMAGTAHCAGWRSGSSSIAERKAGHGNDRAWKAWKAMVPASHPSHTLWKSLRDSHIPTALTTGYVFSCHLNSNHRHRKGLVTDVSGPQRNACPGTLTPTEREQVEPTKNGLSYPKQTRTQMAFGFNNEYPQRRRMRNRR